MIIGQGCYSWPVGGIKPHSLVQYPYHLGHKLLKLLTEPLLYFLYFRELETYNVLENHLILQYSVWYDTILLRFPANYSPVFSLAVRHRPSWWVHAVGSWWMWRPGWTGHRWHEPTAGWWSAWGRHPSADTGNSPARISANIKTLQTLQKKIPI